MMVISASAFAGNGEVGSVGGDQLSSNFSCTVTHSQGRFLSKKTFSKKTINGIVENISIAKTQAFTYFLSAETSCNEKCSFNGLIRVINPNSPETLAGQVLVHNFGANESKSMALDDNSSLEISCDGPQAFGNSWSN